MDNIAEGFGRGGNKEFVNFLTISRGSCLEVQSQLHRASDRRYLDETTFTHLFQLSEIVVTRITNLINYLRQNPNKGPRFR